MLEGKLNISIRDEVVEIEAVDESSRLRFLKVSIKHSDFMSALGRLQSNPMEYEVNNLDKLGKVHEHKQFTFELPDNASYGNQKELAEETIKKVCPEGWIPDNYFNGKDSFFTGSDDKKYARVIIRRYV